MKRVALTALLLMMTGPLVAQNDNGFYFGGGTGFMRIDTDLTSNGLLPDYGDPIESDVFSNTSIAAKLFAGYRIMRYLGVEIGYFKAFDVKESYCFIEPGISPPECTNDRGGIVSSSAWTVELEPRGYSFAATGFWPINDTFELMIKFGGVNSKISATAAETISQFVPTKGATIPPLNPPIDKAVKKSGWDATGSFGLNINHENGFSVRAEIEYFNIKEIDQPWLASLNAIYNF